MRILSMGLLLAAVTAGSVSAQASVNASILPSARSTTVGQAATAFAAITNGGDAEAVNCRLELLNVGPNTINASFGYQTTTPANALSGTPNTPVNIAAGATQNFIFSLTPNSVFTETAAVIDFVCDNGVRASYLPGLTDFTLSSDANAPDILAIGSTLSNDGVARVTTPTGFIPLALSAVNIGSGDPAPDGPSSPSTGNNEATMTVRPEAASLTLPVSFDICEANASSVCIGPRGTTVTANIGDAPSFFVVRVFGRGVGVPLFADVVRVNIAFDDAGGVERGRTSIAATVGGNTVDPQTDTMPSGIWWFDMDGPALAHGEIYRGRMFVDSNGNITVGSARRSYGGQDGEFGFGGQFTSVDPAAQPVPSASGTAQEVISGTAINGLSTLSGRWMPDAFMNMQLTPPTVATDVSGPALNTTDRRRIRAVFNLNTDRAVNSVVATYNVLSENDGTFSNIGSIGIDAQGNLTGVINANGQCPVTGTFIQPTASENIFRLNMTLAAGCDFANQFVGHGNQFSTATITDGLFWLFGNGTNNSNSTVFLTRQSTG